MSFSPTDAAFEGFRLVRRNPMVLLAWTLLYLVVGVATLLTMTSMFPALAELSAAAEAFRGTDPESLDDFMPILSAYGRMFSGMGWVMVLSILTNVMLTTAVSRSVLADHARDVFGHIRLGMDEVRVFVVTLVLSILMGLIAFAVVIVAAIIGGIAVAAIDGWGWIISLVLLLGSVAFVIWLAVRWSLAIPITVAEKKMAFFDSFGVTKGRFWPMLGMMLLALVMAMLVGLLSMLVSMPISLMSGAEMISRASSDPSVMMAAYRIDNAWMWASTVVNAIISALLFGILYAPFAAAYRDLTGRSVTLD